MSTRSIFGLRVRVSDEAHTLLEKYNQLFEDLEASVITDHCPELVNDDLIADVVTKFMSEQFNDKYSLVLSGDYFYIGFCVDTTDIEVNYGACDVMITPDIFFDLSCMKKSYEMKSCSDHECQLGFFNHKI